MYVYIYIYTANRRLICWLMYSHCLISSLLASRARPCWSPTVTWRLARKPWYLSSMSYTYIRAHV